MSGSYISHKTVLEEELPLISVPNYGYQVEVNTISYYNMNLLCFPIIIVLILVAVKNARFFRYFFLT